MKVLQSILDSAEFTQWAAFLQLEPDLGTRVDANCTALAALQGWKPPWGHSRVVDWEAISRG